MVSCALTPSAGQIMTSWRLKGPALPAWTSLSRTVQVRACSPGTLVAPLRASNLASPSRDGAVFVLRVCKLAVIRLLSNDVGELIRPVLMGALIRL